MGKRVTVTLPEELHARLSEEAVREQRSVPNLIANWLEQKVAEEERLAALRTADPVWQKGFGELLERAQRNAAASGLTPEELEREVTLARQEARELRRARRS